MHLDSDYRKLDMEWLNWLGVCLSSTPGFRVGCRRLCDTYKVSSRTQAPVILFDHPWHVVFVFTFSKWFLYLPAPFLQGRQEKDKGRMDSVFPFIRGAIPRNICLTSDWPELCHVITPGCRGVWVNTFCSWAHYFCKQNQTSVWRKKERWLLGKLHCVPWLLRVFKRNKPTRSYKYLPSTQG